MDFFLITKKILDIHILVLLLLNDNCEIGCGSTIDRGSLSNTVIGKNTYLDNQVHVAHNNKIGEQLYYCWTSWFCW